LSYTNGLLSLTGCLTLMVCFH